MTFPKRYKNHQVKSNESILLSTSPRDGRTSPRDGHTSPRDGHTSPRDGHTTSDRDGRTTETNWNDYN
ncbi:MAG: hypothetical protein ACLFRN_07555, partial [Halothece sp.]